MHVRKPPLVWINLLWKPSRHLLHSNSVTRASDQTRESQDSITSFQSTPSFLSHLLPLSVKSRWTQNSPVGQSVLRRFRITGAVLSLSGLAGGPRHAHPVRHHLTRQRGTCEPGQERRAGEVKCSKGGKQFLDVELISVKVCFMFSFMWKKDQPVWGAWRVTVRRERR